MQATEKHWFELLPEVGRPGMTYSVQQKAAFKRIQENIALTERLKREYMERERELEKIAEGTWTPEEIKEAQQAAY